jgi:hypothetical protein
VGNNNKQNRLQKFISNGKSYPILTAISAGLYPVLFYYKSNYTLVNSWGHFGYFMLMFLLLPIIIFVIAHRISKLKIFLKWQKHVLPFLNFFTFLFLLKVCLYAGIQKKILVLVFVIAILFALFLYKHLKKVIVIQFLLILLGAFSLFTTVYKQLTYTDLWTTQPDTIAQAKFKKKPNVYFIQPDGYVNFSEINRGYYDIDNSKFETFLVENDFEIYKDFRSNYASTLSSNSATFMMKHHYYNNGENFSEAINGREIIITKNNVLNIFKKNNYKTYFITEMPYFLLNRP